MNVLGIGHDVWIASAAVVRDGEVVSAICEERLNRQKGFQGFPGKAIDACLKEAGLKFEDLDLVSVGWNPAWHMESPYGRYSSRARWHPEFLYAVPNMLLSRAETFPTGGIEQHFMGCDVPIWYMDHQASHAANAFYLSDFEDAAVFCADGRGERHTTLMGQYDANGLSVINNTTYPHSMGLFYSMVTQYLGHRPHSDEWKVMALASYSSGDDNPFVEPLMKMIWVDEDGTFVSDLSVCGYVAPDSYGTSFYTPRFEELIGIAPRVAESEYEEQHKQLAWALQHVFEERMSEALTILHQKTGLDRVVLSGGCMMNSVYNGMITERTPFKKAFISSCPDDSGIAIGAALGGYFEKLKGTNRVAHPHNYWGPDYDDDIEAVLKGYKIKYQKLDDAPAHAAKMLSEGALIGWYQGRMEFGQRALGNRSILADPRSDTAKDKVNSAVKFREGFRPFAPSILAEHVQDYFITEDESQVPFMERVYKFKPEMGERVPAVYHADGTGRLQTVTADTNPRYHSLISNFHELTGVPIVLNTSFNINGEPVVCTPSDAIRTFYSCGLDALILGDYLIEK